MPETSRSRTILRCSSLTSSSAAASSRPSSLYTITARGSREELLARVNALNPTFCEMLPLTLEEIFINETEVAGYDVKKLLF